MRHSACALLVACGMVMGAIAHAQNDDKPPFPVPKGWTLGTGETRGVFIEDFAKEGFVLTPPDLKDGEFCCVWIGPPFDPERQVDLAPRYVLELMYAGDATLEPKEGKDRHGKPTARFEFTQKRGDGKIEALIHVREDRNGTWVLLFQAGSPSLQKKHLPEFEKMLENWDVKMPFTAK